jgi:outer membrane lipoprotein
MTRMLMLCMALLLFSGCTHAISEKSRKLVDPSLTMERLETGADALKGHYAMLGGVIAGTKNTGQGTSVEVVQFKLDSYGYPVESVHSAGRFLAKSDKFLDPMIYRTGRLMTVVGEVKGKAAIPLDEMKYSYPVIAIKESHVWVAGDTQRSYAYPACYPGPYYWGYDLPPYWNHPPPFW